VFCSGNATGGDERDSARDGHWAPQIDRRARECREPREEGGDGREELVCESTRANERDAWSTHRTCSPHVRCAVQGQPVGPSQAPPHSARIPPRALVPRTRARRKNPQECTQTAHNPPHGSAYLTSRARPQAKMGTRTGKKKERGERRTRGQDTREHSNDLAPQNA